MIGLITTGQPSRRRARARSSTCRRTGSGGRQVELLGGDPPDPLAVHRQPRGMGRRDHVPALGLERDQPCGRDRLDLGHDEQMRLLALGLAARAQRGRIEHVDHGVAMRDLHRRRVGVAIDASTSTRGASPRSRPPCRARRCRAARGARRCRSAAVRARSSHRAAYARPARRARATRRHHPRRRRRPTLAVPRAKLAPDGSTVEPPAAGLRVAGEPAAGPGAARQLRLVSPPVALTLDVVARILAETGRADDEDLEALGPGLVASPGAGRDAHHVPLLDLDDLVVELHPPAPAHDHVHLLLLLVRVAVREAIAGRDALVAEAGLLELERLGRQAELQVRRAVEVGADVLQILLEVPERERHGRDPTARSPRARRPRAPTRRRAPATRS